MTKTRIKLSQVVAYFLLSGLYILLSAPPGNASDATFSWLPNTESNLAGYRIYYGLSPRNYNTTVEVGLPVTSTDGRIYYTVTGLTAGKTYYVAATAYDTNGLESDYSAEVSVTIPSDAGSNNTMPVASFSATPVTGTAPLTVIFDASASTDADGDTLEYIWDFGDGSSRPTTTALTSHTYDVVGSYTATLKVNDGTDISSEKTLVINVTPPTSGGTDTSAPEAAISVDKTSGTVPLTITFDGSGSTPSNANGAIVQFAWNFGDGTSSTGATAQHTYTTAGTYTVTLTVSDDTNLQAATTVEITTSATSSTPSAPASTVSSSSSASNRINMLAVYKLLLLK